MTITVALSEIFEYAGVLVCCGLPAIVILIIFVCGLTIWTANGASQK